MEHHTERLEHLLDAIELSLRQQDGCTKYKDILLDMEKVRSDLRASHERQTVREGMINGQLTRLHDRLDRLHAENKTLHNTMVAKDSTHSRAINTINMHLKYSLGAFAMLVFLLNFFEKIRDFFAILIGTTP